MAAAFLAPLLMGLPGAVSGIIDMVGNIKKLQGRGGALRRRRVSRARRSSPHLAGALSVMRKYPLIERPARYRQGGALSVMRKYPIIERPARYRQGGAMLFPTNLGIVKAAMPLISSLTRGLAAPFRKAAYVTEFMRKGHGGRLPPRPHYVRAHSAVSKNGTPYHVRGHYAAGLALPGGMGGRASPRPHYVRAHKSVRPDGRVVHVRGHYAGGASRGRRPHGGLSLAALPGIRLLRDIVHSIPVAGPLARSIGFGGATRKRRAPARAAHRQHPAAHRVRPHVRMTRNGPVHVRGHLAAGGALATPHKVRPHVRMTQSGPVHVRGHVKGRGLLNPAGYGLY